MYLFHIFHFFTASCRAASSCSQLRENTSFRASWKVRQFMSIRPRLSFASGLRITETRQRYLQDMVS
jgi:hypothetical protein